MPALDPEDYYTEVVIQPTQKPVEEMDAGGAIGDARGSDPEDYYAESAPPPAEVVTEVAYECPYGGPDHVYPSDWKFGGADGSHPGADERFKPTHYQYLDDELGYSFMTGHLLCDDEALDYFTTVAGMDPRVKWLAVKRPGEQKFSVLPWVYVAATDTVHPHEFKAQA